MPPRFAEILDSLEHLELIRDGATVEADAPEPLNHLVEVLRHFGINETDDLVEG